MRVLIAGPGAIGSIFAYLYESHGFEVHAWHYSRERLKEVSEKGITLVLPDGEKKIIKPGIFSEHVDYELAVFTTKAYQLQCALQQLSGRLNAKYYLFMQNGLRHVEIVANYLTRRESIFFGVTTLGGFRESPTKVVVASLRGETLVAPFGEVDKLPDILNLPFLTYHPSYKSILWTKALINAAVNPLTAVMEVQNGELLRPRNFRIVTRIVEEIEHLTARLAIELTTDNPLALVRDVLDKTRTNRSSMLQDILSGRKTENEYITGYIVELAKRLGVDLPANEALYNLVRIKEGVKDESDTGSCQ